MTETNNLLQGSGIVLENGTLAYDVDTDTWIVGNRDSLWGYNITESPPLNVRPNYMHYFRSGIREQRPSRFEAFERWAEAQRELNESGESWTAN